MGVNTVKVDYRKLCVDLFGTDDVNELTKIARTFKEKNSGTILNPFQKSG